MTASCWELRALFWTGLGDNKIKICVIFGNALAKASVDYSLASLFDQIRLESNGTVLERIDRYALIDNVKSMYNDSVSDVMNKSATSLGPDLITPALVQKGATFGAAAANLCCDWRCFDWMY